MFPLPQNSALTLELKPFSGSIANSIIDVSLHGFEVGQCIQLSFVESDATDSKSIREDCVLGTVSGKVVDGVRNGLPALTFIPDGPVFKPASDSFKVGFRFAQPAAPDSGPTPAENVYVFGLTGDRLDVQEGDWWELRIRESLKGLTSQPIPIARIRRQLEDHSQVTYDWHDGNDVQFYHDGSADEHGKAGAFKDLLAAIDQANHFIFVVDWSFHPLCRPVRTASATQDDSIGARLIDKATANKELVVAIHTWDHTNKGAPDSQNDEGDTGLKWIAEGKKLDGRPKNLLWRASSRTGVGWSHHQKFVVLDAPGPNGRRELKVFFGGLDLTKGRFDWPLHVLSPNHPHHKSWPFKQEWSTTNTKLTTNDWYNAEFGDDLTLPRQPWHDIHGQLTGPTAWDFVREFVGRWMYDPSSALLGSDAMGDDGSDHMARIWSLYQLLRTKRDTFVQQHEPRQGSFSAQVYRSLEQVHWGPPDRSPKDATEKRMFEELNWSVSGSFELSIQHAYRRAIDQAEDFIYIENQYLIGSGAHWGKKTIENDLPERIVRRIIARARENKPFHVYVVIPMFPEGKPTDGGILEVRKNEWKTIEYMCKTLNQELGAEWMDRLSFHFLANWSTRSTFAKGKRRDRVKAHERYMIYVHSKLMIVDDRYLIFGSANLNERSLAGDRDTEIACGLWPSRGHEKEGVEAIRKFRLALWEEHFGKKLEGSESPGSSACVTAALAAADENYVNMRSMEVDAKGHICRWPFLIENGSLVVRSNKSFPISEAENLLPDAPDGAEDEWDWSSPGAYAMDLAE